MSSGICNAFDLVCAPYVFLCVRTLRLKRALRRPLTLKFALQGKLAAVSWVRVRHTVSGPPRRVLLRTAFRECPLTCLGTEISWGFRIGEEQRKIDDPAASSGVIRFPLDQQSFNDANDAQTLRAFGLALRASLGRRAPGTAASFSVHMSRLIAVVMPPRDPEEAKSSQALSEPATDSATILSKANVCFAFATEAPDDVSRHLRRRSVSPQARQRRARNTPSPGTSSRKRPRHAVKSSPPSKHRARPLPISPRADAGAVRWWLQSQPTQPDPDTAPTPTPTPMMSKQLSLVRPLSARRVRFFATAEELTKQFALDEKRTSEASATESGVMSYPVITPPPRINHVRKPQPSYRVPVSRDSVLHVIEQQATSQPADPVRDTAGRQSLGPLNRAQWRELVCKTPQDLGSWWAELSGGDGASSTKSLSMPSPLHIKTGAVTISGMPAVRSVLADGAISVVWAKRARPLLVAIRDRQRVIIPCEAASAWESLNLAPAAGPLDVICHTLCTTRLTGATRAAVGAQVRNLGAMYTSCRLGRFSLPSLPAVGQSKAVQGTSICQGRLAEARSSLYTRAVRSIAEALLLGSAQRENFARNNGTPTKASKRDNATGGIPASDREALSQLKLAIRRAVENSPFKSPAEAWASLHPSRTLLLNLVYGEQDERPLRLPLLYACLAIMSQDSGGKSKPIPVAVQVARSDTVVCTGSRPDALRRSAFQVYANAGNPRASLMRMGDDGGAPQGTTRALPVELAPSLSPCVPSSNANLSSPRLEFAYAILAGHSTDGKERVVGSCIDASTMRMHTVVARGGAEDLWRLCVERMLQSLESLDDGAERSDYSVTVTRVGAPMTLKEKQEWEEVAQKSNLTSLLLLCQPSSQSSTVGETVLQIQTRQQGEIGLAVVTTSAPALSLLPIPGSLPGQTSLYFQIVPVGVECRAGPATWLVDTVSLTGTSSKDNRQECECVGLTWSKLYRAAACFGAVSSGAVQPPHISAVLRVKRECDEHLTQFSAAI